MAATLSVQCRDIMRALQSVVTTLQSSNGQANQVDEKQVVDELERFSLWIGNIGATHRPESPLSLESRLREEPDVYEFVSRLLEDLAEVVGELLAITSGEREAEVATSSSDSENDSSLGETSGLLEEIGACITRLFKVTSLVRQAGPTDPFAKALSRSRYQFSDQYDIAHVGEKYPKLATTEDTRLRIRLGRAITERRRYLSYIHDHQEKLEGKHQRDDLLQLATKETESALKLLPMTAAQLDSSSRPSTFFTKASSLVPGQIAPQLLTIDDASDGESDAKSYTTISRSVAGDLDTSAISKIPKLDDLRSGSNKEFECPFCSRVKKFKNERVWRQHVFSDLRSYVCTFPSCDVAYFSDMNDWFRHELQCHRVQYRCHICNDRKFDLGERYIGHVRKEHPEMLNGGDEQQVLDIARRPLDQIRAQDCPCCSDWVDRLNERAEVGIGTSDLSKHTILVDPTVFKRHLASHLEQLALFAVPPGSAEGDVNSDAAVEEGVNVSSGRRELSSLAFTDNNPSLGSSNGEDGSVTTTAMGKHTDFVEQFQDSVPNSHLQQTPHQDVNVNASRGRMARGQGPLITGTYQRSADDVSYEYIDHSYYVRDREFFRLGRVFSIIMNENAGAGRNSQTPDATGYNSSTSIQEKMYYGNRVHINVRRFVVVRSKREFCYALPIFTYSGRATTKRGVDPSQHGIAYELGTQPQLLPGESGIIKPAVAIITALDFTLSVASRIHYGIYHPIQYNVKAKEEGYVLQSNMLYLIDNWEVEEVVNVYHELGADDQGRYDLEEGDLETVEPEQDEEESTQEFQVGEKVMMRVSETRMKPFTVVAATQLASTGWHYQLKSIDGILWDGGQWISEGHVRRVRESDLNITDGVEREVNTREESKPKEDVQGVHGREEGGQGDGEEEHDQDADMKPKVKPLDTKAAHSNPRFDRVALIMYAANQWKRVVNKRKMDRGSAKKERMIEESAEEGSKHPEEQERRAETDTGSISSRASSLAAAGLERIYLITSNSDDDDWPVTSRSVTASQNLIGDRVLDGRGLDYDMASVDKLVFVPFASSRWARATESVRLTYRRHGERSLNSDIFYIVPARLLDSDVVLSSSGGLEAAEDSGSHGSAPQQPSTIATDEYLAPEVEASYITVIDEILRASDLNTISGKRVREGLQERIGYDISRHKDQLTALIIQRFDKMQAEEGSPSGPVTILPVGSERSSSGGDDDDDAAGALSERNSAQEFKIGEEVGMQVVTGHLKGTKTFTVAAAAQDQASRWLYQLRTPDGTLWNTGMWFHESNIWPRVRRRATSDLEEGKLEEDEQRDERRPSNRIKSSQPLFWRGEEVAIVAFEQGVLSPVFTVVASRILETTWQYQLNSIHGLYENGKWIPESDIKSLKSEQETSDREGVQDRGETDEVEDEEEYPMNERDEEAIPTPLESQDRHDLMERGGQRQPPTLTISPSGRTTRTKSRPSSSARRRRAVSMTPAGIEEQRRLLAADLDLMQGGYRAAAAREREERSALLLNQQYSKDDPPRGDGKAADRGHTRQHREDVTSPLGLLRGAERAPRVSDKAVGYEGDDDAESDSDSYDEAPSVLPRIKVNAIRRQREPSREHDTEEDSDEQGRFQRGIAQDRAKERADTFLEWKDKQRAADQEAARQRQRKTREANEDSHVWRDGKPSTFASKRRASSPPADATEPAAPTDRGPDPPLPGYFNPRAPSSSHRTLSSRFDNPAATAASDMPISPDPSDAQPPVPRRGAAVIGAAGQHGDAQETIQALGRAAAQGAEGESDSEDALLFRPRRRWH